VVAREQAQMVGEFDALHAIYGAGRVKPRPPPLASLSSVDPFQQPPQRVGDLPTPSVHVVVGVI
jgi:hypothetical protein